ncbi:MAG TPA: hypothetical protein DDW27_15590 [Bacteroidales bacterium]|nr:hypothetical protein [Bacteroidales bacterium]
MKNKSNLLISALFIVTSVYSFTFGQEAGSLTDPRDGRVYKTVKIDDQVWMAENLAFKTESGCSVYEDVKDYQKTHGYLYTWEAATKACPDGWRLPSMQDWWYLSNFLGGDEQSGGKLKQTGTTSWESPNTGATNSSGFTALASGRGGDKALEHLGKTAFFWTNVDDDDATSWCGALYHDRADLALYPVQKLNGFSVRCIKNSAGNEKVFDFW